ncbi:RNA polymerase sigma factor [Neobacillus sp. LXY-4]|uniref:RNA polymerase sigma factor n=1 Tax=Neobacillus sp. LXY-4 TaxID=3379826 RepID=UPI003EE05B5E
MQEEIEWIQEVLTGNKQAYEKIINKYKDQLYATILRMTKNPQDAQDLVQDAFIKVYHQLEKYNRQGAFSS